MFVPWVLQKANKEKKQPKQKPQRQSKQNTGNSAEENGAEATAADADPSKEDVTSVDSKDKGKEAEANPVYNRYYHLYKQGELEFDAAEAGGKVIESGYEKDNHWAIIIPA